MPRDDWRCLTLYSFKTRVHIFFSNNRLSSFSRPADFKPSDSLPQLVIARERSLAPSAGLVAETRYLSMLFIDVVPSILTGKLWQMVWCVIMVLSRTILSFFFCRFLSRVLFGRPPCVDDYGTVKNNTCCLAVLMITRLSAIIVSYFVFFSGKFWDDHSIDLVAKANLCVKNTQVANPPQHGNKLQSKTACGIPLVSSLAISSHNTDPSSINPEAASLKLSARRLLLAADHGSC